MPNSRSKRHATEQIIEKLREDDAWLNAGRGLAQVIRHPGVGAASITTGVNHAAG